MSTIDEMLAIVNAAKSVPELQARINDLAASLATKEAHANSLESTVNAFRDKTDQLNHIVANLEEERNALGFRAKSAEDRLEKIGSFLGAGMLASQPLAEQSGPKATAEAAGPTSKAEVLPEGPEHQPSTVEAYDPPYTDFPANETANVGGEGATDPTATGHITSTVTTTPSSGDVPTQFAKPEDTASGIDITSTHSPDISTLTLTNVPKSYPYASQPYWNKPAAMTYGEWEDKGGNRPHWADRDTH